MMRFSKMKYAFLIASIFSTNSFAGIYSDDLAKCLVESATSSDKTVLVRWMFSALSSHPDVSSMASVSQADKDKSNKDVALMFNRLLTEVCVTQAKKAVQYEGPSTLETSFNVFGQVAGKELFSNPAVSASILGLQQHIDTKKMQETLGLPAK